MCHREREYQASIDNTNHLNILTSLVPLRSPTAHNIATSKTVKIAANFIAGPESKDKQGRFCKEKGESIYNRIKRLEKGVVRIYVEV